MFRFIKLFAVALCAGCAGVSASAQSSAGATAVDSSLIVPTIDPAFNTPTVVRRVNAGMYSNASQWNTPVKKGVIYVNEEVTTHLILPENIKLVDISTDCVVGNQCAANIVRLKPSFEKDSLGIHRRPIMSNSLIGTITVIGERHIAQFDVLYVLQPIKATSIYKVPYSELDNYVNPEVAMSESDMAKYCWAVYSSKRKFNNISSDRNGIKAIVNNIYSVDDYFFIDFSLINKTNVVYEINEMRVFLTDKKEVKATNSQTIELAPAYSLNLARKFKKDYRNVLVIQKLTFPEEKVLKIEISENQISGRVIELTIEYEDILHADGFSRSLMKKIPDVALPHIYQ